MTVPGMFRPSLERRIAHLEQRLGPGRDAQRRQLARYFMHPRYDSHREAIIEALLSGTACYGFQIRDGEHAGHYSISWFNRDEGGPPLVRVYCLAWSAAVLAVLGEDTKGQSDTIKNAHGSAQP